MTTTWDTDNLHNICQGPQLVEYFQFRKLDEQRVDYLKNKNWIAHPFSLNEEKELT